MYQPEILYLIGKMRHKEFLRIAEQERLLRLIGKNRNGNRSSPYMIDDQIQAHQPKPYESNPRNSSLLFQSLLCMKEE